MIRRMVMVMARAVMMPMATMSMMPLATTSLAASFFRRNAPEAVAAPRALLTLFAAVFRPSAAPALGELANVFFPFAALPVCALSNAASTLVFPA